MFIEVTSDKKGTKSIINSNAIAEVTKTERATRIVLKTAVRDCEIFVKESYDDIKTLLNAKWVAE